MVVSCFSEQPENMQCYKELSLLGKDGRLSVPLAVSSCRLRGKKVIIGFAGIENRNQLESLIGALVLVDRVALPELGENQFYWCHYIGRTVRTVDGQVLGVVETIFSNGAQDVLVLRQEGEAEEFLIPVTEETLVDDSKEVLVVAPPPGLLEINYSSEK